MRRPEEPMKDWRKRRQSLRDDYLAGQKKTAIVEKVIYRDNPETLAKLARAEAALAAMEAKAAQMAAARPAIPDSVRKIVQAYDPGATSEADIVKAARDKWQEYTHRMLSPVLPPLSDPERAEYSVLNSWDKLGGG